MLPKSVLLLLVPRLLGGPSSRGPTGEDLGTPRRQCGLLAIQGGRAVEEGARHLPHHFVQEHLGQVRVQPRAELKGHLQGKQGDD